MMITTRFRNMTIIQWPLLWTLLLLLSQRRLHSFVPWTVGFVIPIITTTSTSRTPSIGSDSFIVPLVPNVKVYESSTTATSRTTASSTTLLYASTMSSSSSSSSSKEVLLDLILNQTPAGRATSSQLTQQILQHIQSLSCPTPEDQVLTALAGPWELLWTAQDPSQPESQRWNNRILNPIENQSFSNNPEGSGNSNNNNNMGRSNPFLPMGVQNWLEQMGIVPASSSSTTRRSTQAIDIKTRTIRNIVSIQFNPNPNSINTNNNIISPRFFGTAASSSSASSTSTPRRVSLTVTVKFTPVQSDARRVNVKFTECRISIPSLTKRKWRNQRNSNSQQQQSNNYEYTFPLGLVGPTGWLRTIYIDDTLRITRGHKGSVFVLSRPRRATV